MGLSKFSNSLWYPWNKTFRKRYDILDYVIGRTYVVSMLNYSLIVLRLVAVMLFLMRSAAENGVIQIFTLYDILGIKLFTRDMLFLITSLEEPTLFQCWNTLMLLYQDLLLFVLNDASCRKWGYPNFYSLWYHDILGIKLFARDMLFLSTSLEKTYVVSILKYPLTSLKQKCCSGCYSWWCYWMKKWCTMSFLLITSISCSWYWTKRWFLVSLLLGPVLYNFLRL